MTRSKQGLWLNFGSQLSISFLQYYNMTERRVVLSSAPAKIILFGEHVVVLGKTAIATSLDMRAYVKVEGNDDNVVELDLPDVNIKQKWNVDQLKYQGNNFEINSVILFTSFLVFI